MVGTRQESKFKALMTYNSTLEGPWYYIDDVIKIQIELISISFTRIGGELSMSGSTREYSFKVLPILFLVLDTRLFIALLYLLFSLWVGYLSASS